MLWLRWSLRDLRARWIQVATIAFIIAIGTGLYAGLSSTSEWRRASYDASYARANMYDLRVSLSAGNTVDSNRLVAAGRSIEHARELRAVEPRLVVPTQVDASTGSKTVLVPGRLVGVDLAHGGPHVNAITATAGTGLTAGDAGADRALLDAHFAKHYGLPAHGTIQVSGGTTLDYVGVGLAPEYFMVVGERGNLLAEANFAVAFVSLETAQRISGHPGGANDLVVTLDPGADRTTIRRELVDAVGAAFPETGFTITGRRADPAYRMLYDDIRGDQRFYNIFAVLVLAGAAFAAFNLTGRIVEAQRRELGIGMALGAPPSKLALRPLLVGAEIASLGAGFGILVGLGVGAFMASITRSYFPLPVWEYPFQPAVFGRALALGFCLPLLATVYPVLRAVRVAPVDAIRTTSVSASTSGLAPLLARIPLPGRTTAQMPLRNVLRTPRRTLMTVLGIAAAIVVLIGVVGMVDSFFATIDVGDRELTKSSPDRLTVQLDTFRPDGNEVVHDIEDTRTIGRSETILQVPATVAHAGRSVDVFLDAVDLGSSLWTPTIEGRVETRGPGIVLSSTAASALGVEPGDRVQLRHPRRSGLLSYELVSDPVEVMGVNPIPIRAVAFMDRDAARLMNLEGITNTIVVEPARGQTTDAVKRSLFGKPGVASVQLVSAYTETIRQELRSALDILTVVEGAVLLLALLIAFNTASINADERAREEATMFAFGLPVRSVLRMEVVESLAIGILGTAVGLGVGWLLLDWLVTGLLPQTFPDLGIVTAVSSRTWATAVLLGVVAVTVAPLFTVRKLRRMDVPSTLRVVE